MPRGSPVGPVGMDEKGVGLRESRRVQHGRLEGRVVEDVELASLETEWTEEDEGHQMRTEVGRSVVGPSLRR